MLHVVSVCTPCCMLLRVFGSCCGKFETGQTFSCVQTDTTSAYHLNGKPGNSGENWNGTVHPVEIFRKKVIPFEVLPFFPFSPKRPKFFVPFVWLTSARLPLKAEGEKWRSFPSWVMFTLARTASILQRYSMTFYNFTAKVQVSDI